MCHVPMGVDNKGVATREGTADDAVRAEEDAQLVRRVDAEDADGGGEHECERREQRADHRDRAAAPVLTHEHRERRCTHANASSSLTLEALTMDDALGTMHALTHD